jgi:hypothetical protein
MKKLFLVAVLLGAPLAGCNAADDSETTEAALNVNSRYRIESVHLVGQRGQLSNPLRTEINRLQGEKLDDSILKRLADRIKRELNAANVSISVQKGTLPERVVVNFEVKSHQQPLDLKLAKFVYHSKQGWTADGSASTMIGGNAISFGLVSDADALVERFSGVRAKFERRNLWHDRLGLRFEFGSFHQQWNEATLAAASPSDIYRSRQFFMPEATLVLARPLELSFGVSFARYRPSLPAAKSGSANAVVTTLRYHQRWGSEQDEREQEALAEYSLRAATHLLDSDPDLHAARSSRRVGARRGKHKVRRDFWPAASTATPHCSSVSRWAMRPRCAAGTSLNSIRSAAPRSCTPRSTTISITSQSSTIRVRCGTSRSIANRSKAWVPVSTSRKVFSSPWRSRCGPVLSSPFFMRA